MAFDLDEELNRDRPRENPVHFALWSHLGELAVVIPELLHRLALVNRRSVLLGEI